MPGRASSSKGYRREREIVDMHAGLGIPAERVPLSGSAGGSFGGDVIIGPLDTGRGYMTKLRAEVKARGKGKGFVLLERWLGANDVLFLRRDRAEPMAVLPWTTYALLARRVAETSKGPWKDGVPEVRNEKARP